jgi:hypothetical protein
MNSAVYQYLLALKTKLEARLVAPDWPRTTVYWSLPQEPALTMDDCVALIGHGPGLQVSQMYATNVRDRDQDIQIPVLCQASALQTAQSSNGDQDRAAFERVDQLLGEVIAQLRDDPPDAGDIPIIGQRKSEVSDVRFRPYWKESGGFCYLAFATVSTSVRVL